jgi:hypothetical protein
MAGEIQLNSTTMATESSGTITLSNVNSATNRTNLGLGSIATQAADSVAITGGSISSDLSAVKLITSKTPTAATTVEFTESDIFSANYSMVKFIFTNISPATDNSDLLAEVRVSGTYQTANYKGFHRRHFYGQGATIEIATNSTTNWELAADIGTDTSELGFGELDLYSTSTSDWQYYKSEFVVQDSTATPALYHGGGQFQSTTAIDGIRFRWSTGGNFDASGKIYVYGFRI